MGWIEMVVVLVAGLVALMAVILVKRPRDIDALGAVSAQWIAQHRVDAP